MNIALKWHFLLFAQVIFSLGGCTLNSTQLNVEQTEDEINRSDRLIGLDLRPGFEAQLKLRADSALEGYLRYMGARLAEQTRRTPKDALVIRLFKEPIKSSEVTSPSDQKFSYSLPGASIYLSCGSVLKTEYENELAALISLELGNLEIRRATKKIDSMRSLSNGPYNFRVDYFGPNGIYTYNETNETEDLEAIDSAVSILYSGGYDGRGMVSILQKLNSSAVRLKRARETFSSFAPLRNPVVRSALFIEMQKRIQKACL